MKKKIALTVVAVLIVMVSVAVAGCNKFSTDAPALSDIYVNYSSTQAELDGAALELILPDGWTVLSSASGDNADSDIGYIASMNAFIVTNSNHDLSVVKVPEGEDKTVTEEDFLIPPASAVRAIKAVGSYFAVRVASSSGFVGVMDTEGNWRVNANKTRSTGAAVDKNTLSSAIRILDDELVAVAPANAADSDITGSRNYTPVYRISTGKLVCCINTGGTLDNMLAFDGSYISVETSSTSTGKETRIYAIPDTLPEKCDLDYPRHGSFVNDADYDGYYTESLYLGEGRFYVHTEWTVDADETYTYAYDGEYYRAVRYIYFPDDDDREQYTSAHIFLNAVNSYYDNVTGRSLDGVTVAPSSFLKDGYIYASFGLIVDADKNAHYDQFVLDKNLNIVYSLTTNFGIRPEGSLDREEVGLFDLMMQGSDGYYYARLYPSAIRLYKADGTLVFERTGHDFTSAGLQNGIIIAGIKNEDGDVLYGAYNLNGDNVIPFEYSYIEPFRSYYTYAIKADGKTRVMLGRGGTEAPLAEGATGHFADIASSSDKSDLEKRGCYVFTSKTDEGKTLYGVKNMSGDYGADVILSASLSSCTLYSPRSDNSLVFAWGTRAEDGAYVVYRMTASGEAETYAPDGGLPDWGIGLIAAGCTLVVAAAVIAIVVAVRKKRLGEGKTE